jgi:hypothetical protein
MGPVYLFVGASLEERRLRQEFGVLHEEYARSTPMILPRLIQKKIGFSFRNCLFTGIEPC